MRRYATTVVLLFVAVALGVWLWIDRDRVTTGEKGRRENNVFTAWRREELSRVEIVHDGETIVLVRDAKADSAWRMTSPLEERVDQAAAERLLTTMEFATVVRKVGDDTAGLGFEAPRAAGSVTMGPLAFRFVLGAASPRPEGSSYLRIDEGAPFVASRELTDALLARADTYRDRTVVPYLSLDLSRFEIKHAGGGFAVERSDDRSFKVVGKGVFASRAALDKVWGALAEMRAEAFPKDVDADRLTANPRLTIAMSAKDPGKPPGELVVGDPCPGQPNDVVVLRKAPSRVAACAPKGAIEALLAVTPDALVDRKPFAFRHDEIEELRLERIDPADAGAAPRAIEVARRGTGFHLREPADRELTAEEAEAVGDLLSRIEQASADDVRAGGGPFSAIARARVRAGEREETIEIGTTVVRRLRDDARLTVAPAIVRLLVPRATTTKPRTLLSDTRRVSRVVLRGCSTSQELVDDGSGLRLVVPAGYETDGSITQLVDGIVRNGRVLAWIADADDGSFGFSPEGCRVVLAFADGNAPVTVRFGAEGDGGVYGTIDGRPEVFVAPAALHELAKRIYVSHASLRVEPDAIESVNVTVRGKPVVHPRQRDAAGALYADHVVSLGAAEVGPTDVEITIARAEGGRPKRVVCSAITTTATGSWRRCATPDVKAVFDVRASLVDALLAPPQADAAASRE